MNKKIPPKQKRKLEKLKKEKSSDKLSFFEKAIELFEKSDKDNEKKILEQIKKSIKKNYNKKMTPIQLMNLKIKNKNNTGNQNEDLILENIQSEEDFKKNNQIEQIDDKIIFNENNETKNIIYESEDDNNIELGIKNSNKKIEKNDKLKNEEENFPEDLLSETKLNSDFVNLLRNIQDFYKNTQDTILKNVKEKKTIIEDKFNNKIDIQDIKEKDSKIENIELKDKIHKINENRSHKFIIRGLEIDISIGTLATQSNMSLVLSYKSLSLLFTLDISKDFDPNNQSQFSVNFITKSYAFSKIPNNPGKREVKTSERDILVSRLIDRSIRPLIDKNFTLSSQLICTLLSYPVNAITSDSDEFFDIEFLAVLGSSITIYLSSMPLSGIPIPCRVLMKKEDVSNEENNQNNLENKTICFPFISEIKNFYIDLFLCFNNEELIMIECESNQASKEEIISCISLAKEKIENIVLFIKNLAKIYKKNEINIQSIDDNIKKQIFEEFNEKYIDALYSNSKFDRNNDLMILEKKIINFYKSNFNEDISTNLLENIILYIKRKKYFNNLNNNSLRIDKRKLDEMRMLEMKANLNFMESSHGSGLFSRKPKYNIDLKDDIIKNQDATTALASVVFGNMHDEQLVEGFESDKKERFILHYNFLPYATGEAYQIKNTNRREIGHGRLAQKALKNLLPEKKTFPYTIRVCCEILSCDGSSSMATICASSIAIIDAGVPLSSLAAGISIGVIKDPDDKEYDLKDILILTDIIAEEDYIGNMDFKIAGTKKGITAIQMDVKDFGIKDNQTLDKILSEGIKNYNNIIDEMSDQILSVNKELKINVPSISQISIEKNFVKSIIGNRGETIKTISDVSGAKIDIDSSGNEFAIINIFGPNKKSIEKAEKIIQDLILQPEIGKIYDGIIDKITDFGIFVRFLNDKARGLIHERNCEGDRYDFYNKKKNLKTGDPIKIKVLFISSDGKVGLSIIDDSIESSNKTDKISDNNKIKNPDIIENQIRNNINDRESSIEENLIIIEKKDEINLFNFF